MAYENVFVAPDGSEYTAANATEAQSLQFGFGYRPKADVKREEREAKKSEEAETASGEKSNVKGEEKPVVKARVEQK